MCKSNNKRSYFTNEEDKKLITLYQIYNGKWKIISQLLKTKTPRQCRERWVNYLSSAKRQNSFTEKELKYLFELVSLYGHNWRIISYQMNFNEVQVKNAWKKVLNGIITHYI